MSPRLPPINASSSAIDLADWLELRALSDTDRNASVQDLIAELRRSGTVETYLDDSQADVDGDLVDAGHRDITSSVDSRGELSEVIAEAVFDEIESRSRAAGTGYAYDIDDDFIQLKSQLDATGSTYIFQLLLSLEGSVEAEEPKLFPDRQFESLCVRALQSYLGGIENSQGYKFGFPRQQPYKSFGDAIGHIIHMIGEGGIFRSDPIASSMKDGKLDVVVSIPFDDRNSSQLIAFGQCATGTDWESKLGELYDLPNWCNQWMTDPPVVAPIKTFFIPHCVPYNRWKYSSRQGGILFERCRISSKFAMLDNIEFYSARRWTQRVLQTREFPESLLETSTTASAQHD